MKRYWLFHFNHFYPVGGMGDFILAYTDLSEAVAEGKRLILERSHHQTKWSVAHVVDIQTHDVIEIEVTNEELTAK